jgi:tRNA (guanine10-N2)-methyltransferase
LLQIETMAVRGLRYLFWCANEHLDFRIPEFEALAKIFDVPLEWVERENRQPWVVLNLRTEDDARKLLSRSVATKWCVELWGEGDSLSKMHERVAQCPRSLTDPHLDKSFKIRIEPFMRRLTSKQKIQRIEAFAYLPLRGKVKLDQPDIELTCMEYYGLDHNRAPEEPLRVFFGRLIGEGQRDLMAKLSIKKRKFIGNTTMDPQLSLYMANLACVITISHVSCRHRFSLLYVNCVI